MSHTEVIELLMQIRCRDFVFRAALDGSWIQVKRWGLDSDTNKLDWIKGRKWRLSEHMTKSEVVQTALKACIAFEEHEVREAFTYKNKAIFGPHLSIDKLVEFCGLPDNKSKRTGAAE